MGKAGYRWPKKVTATLPPCSAIEEFGRPFPPLAQLLLPFLRLVTGWLGGSFTATTVSYSRISVRCLSKAPHSRAVFQVGELFEYYSKASTNDEMHIRGTRVLSVLLKVRSLS
jgi:hypothetical protein